MCSIALSESVVFYLRRPGFESGLLQSSEMNVAVCLSFSKLPRQAVYQIGLDGHWAWSEELPALHSRRQTLQARVVERGRVGNARPPARILYLLCTFIWNCSLQIYLPKTLHKHVASQRKQHVYNIQLQLYMHQHAGSTRPLVLVNNTVINK